jgi:CubicO group peptidase (beta-lactamase class C family)
MHTELRPAAGRSRLAACLLYHAAICGNSILRRQTPLQLLSRDCFSGDLALKCHGMQSTQRNLPVTDEKLQAAIPELERLAHTAITDRRIPGLAIGIVYKGKAVYLNGFGVREVGKPDLVDPDTVFQLASASKPLSSTIVSSLVSDGTVNWDDPVVKYDPEFQLSDPAVTSKVTIGDFFAHRSGLPGEAATI